MWQVDAPWMVTCTTSSPPSAGTEARDVEIAALRLAGGGTKAAEAGVSAPVASSAGEARHTVRAGKIETVISLRGNFFPFARLGEVHLRPLLWPRQWPATTALPDRTDHSTVWRSA